MAQSKAASTSRKLLYYRRDPSLNSPEYLDIAEGLSATNRRSYRQAMNYAVENIRITHSVDMPGYMVVLGVPHCWTVDNATTKIYNLWMQQRREALKLNPELKAKWSDFKVFLDSQHKEVWAAQGNLGQIYFNDSNSTAATPQGEWDPSKITYPDHALQPGQGQPNKPMHIVGYNVPNADLSNSTESIGIVHEYMNTKSKIFVPDPTPMVSDPEHGLYNLMASHDQISETSLQNVMEHNDQPPYDRDVMLGDGSFPALQCLSILRFNNFGNTGSTTISADTGPMIAPFGLLKFVWFPEDETQTNINPLYEINLAPGKYKGVLAERGV